MTQKPFWEAKTLGEMTPQEWEALCDRCGRCCLNKLRCPESGEILWTSVGCRLLDTETGQCTRYASRRRWVRDCISLTPALLETIDWLPPSCAYLLLYQGKKLPAWHPLLSPGAEWTPASVAGKITSERQAGDLEDYIVKWPGEWPNQEADD